MFQHLLVLLRKAFRISLCRDLLRYDMKAQTFHTLRDQKSSPVKTSGESLKTRYVILHLWASGHF